MLSKILFTLAIIIGVFLFVRLRQQRLLQRARPPLHLMGGEQTKTPSRKRWGVRGLAGVAVALMLAAFGFLLYDYWRDANQVIQLTVINTTNGNSTAYSAYRGDISAREFTTLDGVRVLLSEHDRIEFNRSPHLQPPARQN